MKAEELILDVIRALLIKQEKGLKTRVGVGQKILKPYRDDKPLGITVSTNKLIEKFVSDGLIEIIRTKGSPGFTAVTLKNTEKALSVVNHIPLSERITVAIKYLDHIVGEKPVYAEMKGEIKETWKASKFYLRFKPDDYVVLADTILGVDLILSKERGFDDIDYRHLSVKLYNNSKRFDALKNKIAKMIDELADDPIGLEAHEILSSYGISPISHPVYLSGPIVLCSGSFKLDGSFPDSIGVWANKVDNVLQGQNVLETITTIENQATFLKYAKDRKDSELVIYTAGIPSPSFKKLYRLIVSALPNANLRHWGDIDLGGFIILSMIEKTAGKSVSAFRMCPKIYSQNNGQFTNSEENRMKNIHLSRENREVLNECLKYGMKFEQEAFE